MPCFYCGKGSTITSIIPKGTEQLCCTEANFHIVIRMLCVQVSVPAVPCSNAPVNSKVACGELHRHNREYELHLSWHHLKTGVSVEATQYKARWKPVFITIIISPIDYPYTLQS